MECNELQYNDLYNIKRLQPDGWPDIIPEFEFYIQKKFCYPIKMTIDNIILGVGAAIIFEDTAWLAHIIVDSEYRKKGIGSQIVFELLKIFKNHSVKTFLLIATEIGMSIYLKSGFKIVTPYRFLKREAPWNAYPISSKIEHYRNEYYKIILKLDKKVSGENREFIFKEHLNESLLYIDNDEVKGYYIPNFGEGTIVADNHNAGIELMKIKYSKSDKAVIPSDNVAAIQFLLENGFVDTNTKGVRMILGDELLWKPQKIFSRVGGNYG